MKYFLLALVLVFIGIPVLIGVGFVINIIFFPVNTAQKEVSIAYQAQDQVLNAQNAIYNYEWFKQTYQDIQANEQQLANATSSLAQFETELGPRKDWDYETETEDSQLRSVVLGLENYLATNIANYNAHASEATRNIFQNSVLPSYINTLTFITK